MDLLRKRITRLHREVLQKTTHRSIGEHPFYAIFLITISVGIELNYTLLELVAGRLIDAIPETRPPVCSGQLLVFLLDLNL